MNRKATIRAIFILFALALSAGAQTITVKVVAIADGDTQWKANTL